MHIDLKRVKHELRRRIGRNTGRPFAGFAALKDIRHWSAHVKLSRVWAVLVLSTYAGLAAAQAAGAPWESGLCGVAGWFKGPTMIAVGTIAFAAAAAGFVWGEDLTGIMKKVVNIVAAIALAIGGSAVVGWIAMKAGAAASQCPVV